MLRFAHGARQRLLRLRALTHPAVLRKHARASRTAAALGALTRHATALHQGPEHLYHAHATLATQLPVPLFDVASARDIGATGALQLPGFVTDLAPELAPPAARQSTKTGCGTIRRG